MKKDLAKYLLYYPTTWVRREPVAKFLRKYRESQYWSTDSMEAYQAHAFRDLFHGARLRSQYWMTKTSGVELGNSDLKSALKKIPILTKQALISNYKSIITREFWLDDIKTTGGSTGQPVQIRKDSLSLARERAGTWRGYEWAGIGVAAPQGRIWGQPISRGGRLRYNLIDFIANRVRLSAFSLTDENFEIYQKKLLKFRPEYIYGYVSAIQEFLSYVNRKNLALPDSLKCIISTSELLTPEIRTELQAISGLPVYNEYGCGEVGSIAHECERGNMHVISENMIVEVDDTCDREDGDILVTDLHNFVTPLMRYSVGDYGQLSKDKCACGRSLPILSRIYGRAYDLLIAPDGRKIHPELPIYVFEEAKRRIAGIEKFQIEQTGANGFVLRIIAGHELDKGMAIAFLESRMRQVLWPSVRFEIYFVLNIPREASGKMRVVKRSYD